MPLTPHIAVIDPAVKEPEIDCFNHLLSLSPLPLTYHLPALQGIKSLSREKEDLRGIVIFGSASSVHSRLLWQTALEGWLKPRLDSGLPAFGCCYGHQMLAYMYGGRIEYLHPDQKKIVGFRSVHLSPNPLWGPAQVGSLYVTHNEVVSAAPARFQVSAWSNEVAIDGLAHLSLPLWSFQPHPEATKGFAEEDGVKPGPTSFDFGYVLLKRFLEFCSRNQ